jgi:hypothetical protein
MFKAKTIDPAMLGALEMQLGVLARMDIDQLKAMSKEQAAGFVDLGSDMKSAMAAMDQIPLILMLPLLESYTKGALPAFEAYKHGGWAEVAKLYSNPPASTEQVLHPAEKLYPTRDEPRAITIPTPAGTTLVYGETMGELEWRVYFMLWNKPAATSAAAGWDGDRYAVVRGKDGALTGLVATVWDGPAEAEEFETAYRASLAARFGGDGTKRNDGRAVGVRRDGDRVLIIDGMADPAELEAFARAVKIR